MIDRALTINEESRLAWKTSTRPRGYTPAVRRALSRQDRDADLPRTVPYPQCTDPGAGLCHGSGWLGAEVTVALRNG